MTNRGVAQPGSAPALGAGNLSSNHQSSCINLANETAGSSPALPIPLPNQSHTTEDTNRAKHTPGPWWIADGYIRGGKRPFSRRHTGTAIARMMWSGVEARANADLIAAAPELLEALEALLTYPFQAHIGDPIGLAVWNAQSAIRKAKGEL